MHPWLQELREFMNTQIAWSKSSDQRGGQRTTLRNHGGWEISTNMWFPHSHHFGWSYKSKRNQPWFPDFPNYSSFKKNFERHCDAPFTQKNQLSQNYSIFTTGNLSLAIILIGPVPVQYPSKVLFFTKKHHGNLRYPPPKATPHKK